MANSADTVTLNERPSQRNIAETSPGPVDVARAEALFVELSRQLTASSKIAGEASKSNAANDLEKGSADAKEPFDLREYLKSSNDANQRAGIKHKHVGVTWEDLQVDVFGGANSKVTSILIISALAAILITCEVLCENLRKYVQFFGRST